MREILFRGKSTDTGAWVYGYYCGSFGDFDEHEICDIADPTCSRVDVVPETVGQYTGLIDRHGKRIFENDIVEVCGGREERYLIWWVRETSMLTAIPVDGISFNGQDYWNGYYPQFEYSTFCLMMQDPWGDFRDIRVIGNIHDNPELIGGTDNG